MDYIHIPARKLRPSDSQQVIRVSAEAYNKLVEIYDESTLPIKAIASLLIIEASKRVIYDKEEEKNADSSDI